LSLLELIVVMGIIGLLVSLSLPAVTRSRQAARRLQCQNNLRQIGLALLQTTDVAGRFPACGNFGHDGNHHSWVVDVLPWLDQSTIASQWDKDKPIDDPVNAPLAALFVPILTCPSDISVTMSTSKKTARGDLSYVVNGGVGFTVERSPGQHDCPIDPKGRTLDLNGNGVLCPQPPDLETDGSPSDRDQFFRMGLFFNETWKWEVTVRHHRPATIVDGMSQTFLISENVRTGHDPKNPEATWASPNPYLTSFYIGDPCPDGKCLPGTVDYQRCNAGESAINRGLDQPEGSAPYPSSFHEGGVNMTFCDGRVVPLSQNIDGGVYAALASPAGSLLTETPLQQTVNVDLNF